MNKVLIGTNCAPKTRLGGPDKFTPIFFAMMKKNETLKGNYVFKGYFNDKVIEDVNEIIYDKNPEVNPTLKFRVMKYLEKYPQILVPLRKISTIIKKIKNAELYRKIDDEFDLVHFHDFFAVNRFTSIKKPIIMTNHFKGSLYNESTQFKKNMEHNLWREFHQNGEIKAILRSDIITFPSESARNLLLDDYPLLKEKILSKSRIIYTGIEDLLFGKEISIEEFKKRKNLVLNIGNHIPDKGVYDAVQSFINLFKDNKEIHFVNVGSFGPETEKIKKLIAEYNLEDRIELKGVVDYKQVLEYLKIASFVIHTPRRVVFDLSLLEAMSAMIPVISSKVLGNMEALGKDHLLYIDSEFKIEKMELLSDKDGLFAIACKQRDIFKERFNVEAMMHNYEQLYKEFICQSEKS